MKAKAAREREREKEYLEQLNANVGEHKVEQKGDQHNVADGFDRNDHALNHVLNEQKLMDYWCGPKRTTDNKERVG